MRVKPNDISQEQFDRMIDAMLAYRDAMLISRGKPFNLSPRSNEARISKENVLKAQSALWNTFFPEDDEDN